MGIRVSLSEALGGGLCGLGAGLLTAPRETLGRAGVRPDGEVEVLLARMLGLRNLTLGALLLGARGAAARRKLQRLVAGMCAAEVCLLALSYKRLPGRSAPLLIGTTALAGLQALAASTSAYDVPNGGVPLLVAGYALSMAPTLSLVPVVRDGDLRRFATFEAGTTLAGAGWLLRRNRGGAAANLLAGAGAGAWWAIIRLLERRRRATAA
jgi:hypothetical protein